MLYARMLSVSVALSLSTATVAHAQSDTARSVDLRYVARPSHAFASGVAPRRVAPDSTNREWHHATRNGALVGFGVGLIGSLITADRVGVQDCTMESRSCNRTSDLVTFVGIGTAVSTGLGALIGGTIGLVHNAVVAR